MTYTSYRPAFGRAWLVALLGAVTVSRAARAGADTSASSAEGRDALIPSRWYARLLAMATVGEGLRFNNPYRLPHELGEGGESISSTAPYGDVGFGALFGRPDGLQHGGYLGWSWALTGVPQYVMTPSYCALYRGPHRWLVFGRAGIPIILGPDANVGAELAVGAAWFATAGIGLTASLLGDAFYGAGTRDTQAAFYPVLSAEAGLVFDYEVLP